MAPRRLTVVLCTVALGGLAALAGASDDGGAQLSRTRGAASPVAPPGLRISPAPGTPDASPRTQVSLLGLQAQQLRSITVTGSQSGRHPGRLLPYSQGDGASFLPARPFIPGELVRVRVVALAQTHVGAQDVSFSIARPGDVPKALPSANPAAPASVQSFVSRPDLHPPAVRMLTSGARSGGGDLFLAPYLSSLRRGRYGPMIVDPGGGLVWFLALARGQEAAGFRVQRYLGAPVLTRWQGHISALGYGDGEDVIADRSYRTIARVRAGNGYHADLHEFELLANATALITVFSPVRWDLTSVHGSRHGTLLDCIVQEIDVRTGLVRFEWHSLGHIDPRESYAQPPQNGNPFDPFHVNSDNLTPGGDLLVSARNTWAVYDIDRQSAAIRWRLGGRRSDFHVPGAARFAWQHDARQQPDGALALFDNGATPKVHAQSRGLVLALDVHSNRVSVLSRYEHVRPLSAASQGSLQRLADGDTLLGWGSAPWLTEYDRAGRVVLDAELEGPYASFRASRYPWSGQPTGSPALAVRHGTGRAVRLYASWNGATRVARWQVLGGARPDRLRALATVPRRGFETTVSLAAAPGLLAERALSAHGQALGRSMAVRTAGSASAVRPGGPAG